MKKLKFGAFLTVVLFLCPQIAWGAVLDGSELSLWWGIPFAATLLSIAIVPVVAPIFWHHHYGKITALWALVFVVPFALMFGFEALWVNFIHALVAEYIPFILLLLALFVVAGGIYIQTDIRATPLVNVGILGLGGILASVMGTTGASMLLIRPLIRANQHRKRCAHAVIFFIFIVSNIGGALTPLGDPPLFLGFLKGINFFWTIQHLLPQMLFLIGALLVLFFLLDNWMLKKEMAEGSLAQKAESSVPAEKFCIQGYANFILLIVIVCLVLLSGIWKPGIEFDIAGTILTLPSLVRDIGLIAVVIVSLRITERSVRRSNQFTWGPILEVAKLFAGIFMTIIPVIAMLRAGLNGPFASIVASVTNAQGEPIPLMYFWATGLLSSFLDNAPTYLVFFNTASGDPSVLMTTMAGTLAAISAGAVFMGANTYIGNAPNLMVKAIAEDRGVRMPSFFGYMAWSFGILVPLFTIISFVWYCA